EPHDYCDTAVGACKALTVTRYARQNNIPLTGVTVEITHDGSRESEGHYTLSVKLTLRGALTDDQRAALKRVARRCRLHKLMTTSEISIESHPAEGAFTQ